MFQNILGHERPKEILRRAMAEQQIPHAYLFTGDPALGKFRMAIEFAKAVNCEGAVRFPCACRSCRLIDVSAHPDVSTVSPEGNNIKIQQIRSLQQKTMLKPQLGKRKVYVIDEAEKMTREAANCFLKTLEEPPNRCTIILITSNPHLLLPTLLSRCQKIFFSPLSDDKIQDMLLSRLNISPEQAADVAHYAMGKIGLALTTPPERLSEEKTELVNFLIFKIHEGVSAIFKTAEDWGRDHDTTRNKLLWFSLFLRDLLLIKLNQSPELGGDPEWVTPLQTYAERLSFAHIADLHHQVIKAQEGLSRNLNRQLSFEQLFLTFRHSIGGSSVEKPDGRVQYNQGTT